MTTRIINLSQNENLHGFPKSILQKTHKILEEAGLITYRREGHLRAKLGKKHAVKTDNIFLESGAEGGLREIFINLSLLPNSKILLSDILWDYYKQLAKRHNIGSAFYQLKENKKKNTYEFDLKEIENTINREKPTALIINSPHNPTGHELNEKDLTRLLKTTNKEIIIILDETYFGFGKNEDNRGILVKQYPNLVIIRSFSKFYALAGVRIGYLLIGDFARDRLNIYAPYLGHNFITEEIASLVLDDTKFYESTKTNINKQKKHLYNYFNKVRGFHPFKSAANFILIRLSEKLHSNTEYARFMEKNGYKIKVFTEGKLSNCIRIAIPPKEHIQNLIRLTSSFVQTKNQ